MRVLLINPPIQTNLPVGFFPLGLGYIAHILIKEGHSVTIYDINAFGHSKVRVQHDIKGFVTQYDVIGISGLITLYNYIKWLIQTIKDHNPAMPIIVGGSVASSIPGLLLEKTGAAIACIGEGEVTIKELISALENSAPLMSVKGIRFKQDGQIFQTPPRELIQNLDSIPFPLWNLFPVDVYIKNPIIVTGPVRSMNTISGRGCPYHCIYCYRNFGNRVRFRSIDNIIEEVRYLKEKYKIQHIAFQDELFTINKKRVYDFCQGFIKGKINITWRCLGRANLVDDLKMLKLMKSAGCHWIGYGIESGSQRMLNSMHKGITVEQAKRAIRLTREAGIIPSATFMIGMPGETRKTIQETVDFCKDTRIFNIPFFAVPYPGTYLYNQLKNNGFVKNEEEFVLKMEGDATDLHINMTKFSDNELINMKKKAEKEICDYVAINLPNKIKLIIKDIVNHYKWWGLRSAYRYALEVTHNPGSKMGSLFKRLYFLAFGNVMSLNRYLRIMYIKPELDKINKQKILDIGCGDGHFTHFMTGHNNKVFAVDLRDYGIFRYAGIKFSQVDAHFLPYRDSSFDFVFCSDVFEHVSDYESIVSEIIRVLKPNRQCLISTVEGHWRSPIKIRKFLLRLPDIVKEIILGAFNRQDEELDKNFLGHISLDITLNDLEDSLLKNGLTIVKKKTYCHLMGALLMEVFFSFNEKVRYFIFPFLRLMLPLDTVFKNKYYWQFYIIAQK